MTSACLRLGDRLIRVAVPESWKEMENGLVGFEPELRQDNGMIFLGRGEPVDMWMSKVNVPLDMVWLKADGRVGKILRSVKPGDRKTYSGPGVACVELIGGTARALGITVGAPWTLLQAKSC